MAAPSQNHGETACLIEQDGESSRGEEAICQPSQLEVEGVFSHQDHFKQKLTFRRLPPEVRNMIWHAALAPRVIIINPKERNAETDSPNKVDFNAVPGMLFANRESRLIAQRHYNQRFILNFSTEMPIVQPDGSTSRLICQIPVIMSALDEIAFSRSQICTQIQDHDSLRISIDTAFGAPQAEITRVSVLSDRLISHGINTEQLARLLDPTAPEYLSYIIFSNGTSSWNPFSRCSEPELSQLYPEGVESLCIEIGFDPCIGLGDWWNSEYTIAYDSEICTMGLRR